MAWAFDFCTFGAVQAIDAHGSQQSVAARTRRRQRQRARKSKAQAEARFWSTKHRERWIADEDRERLHACAIGVLVNLGCPSLETNSEPDHIHILCSLSRTITIAQLVEKVKTSTSAWMKTLGPRYAEFHWQGGYSAFSVSESLVPRVREYIRN